MSRNPQNFPKLDLGTATMSVFSSINDKCKEVYDNTEKGNSFLESLNYSVNKIVTFLDATMSIQNITSRGNATLNSSLVFGLGNINTSIQKQTQDIVNAIERNAPDAPANNLADTVRVFFDILSQVREQVQLLRQGSSATPRASSSSSTNASPTEKKSLLSTVTGFSSAIASLAKDLTMKLIKNLDKFTVSFNKLLDTSSSARIDNFNNSFKKFTDNFANVGALTKQIGMLALSFFLLTLSVASPLTIVAVGVFTLWVKMLANIVDNRRFDTGLKNFALGIGILTLSFIVLGFVEWSSPMMLLGFMVGLGMIMKRYNFDRGGARNSMVMFSMGIAILTLTLFVFEEVQWTSVFKFLLFIGGLGIIMHTFNFDRSGTRNSMVMFALGIGLLTLTLFVFEEVNWSSVFKFLLFVGGLGLIMKAFNFTGVGARNSMITFSIGLAILTLTLFVFEEVQWESVFKFLVFMAGIGLIMKVFSFQTAGLQMILFSVGLGVMVGVLWLFKQVDFTWNDMLLLTGIFAGLGLVYVGISLVAPAIAVGASTMLILFGSLALGVLALWGITKIKFKEENFRMFMTCVGIIIMGFASLVLESVTGLVGALAFIPIAVATMVGALVLWAVSNMTFDQSNIDNVAGFMTCVGIIIKGFAWLTVPAVLGLVGAVAFIPIVVSALVGALVLWGISNIKFNTENIKLYMSNVETLIKGFAWLALPAVAGLAGAVLFLPIALSAYAGVKVLQQISALKVNTANINIYGTSIKTLVAQFSDLSGWNLAKTSAKALLLLPILNTAYLASKVLQNISNLKINKTAIAEFGTTTDMLITTILSTLDRNAERIEASKDNVARLSRLLNVISSIAKTVGMMSNMQFNEYGVKDGKLVLTGTRKLEPKDFENVGKNIMTMLSCLVDPLNKIGSGILITDQTEEGIETIGVIVNAFKPLIDIIDKYSKLPVASDPKLMRLMSNSLLLLVNTFEYVFAKMNNFKMNAVEVAVENMGDFMEIFEDAKTKNVTDLNKIMSGFINMMTNDSKWKKINKNLTDLKTSLVGVSKAMNSIDLQKALTFERTVKRLSEKTTASDLRSAVEALSELLSVANKNNETNNTIKEATVASAQVATGNTVTGGLFGMPSFGSPVKATPTNATPKGKVNTNKVNDTQLNQMLLDSIQSLLAEAGKISSILSGTLKVKNVADPRGI